MIFTGQKPNKEKFMIKKVPNILCFIRIALIPFILLFLLENPFSEMFAVSVRVLVSGILFGIAMITDAFDGKIARKYDAITNFGKFFDPIADKMLVISLLLGFVELGLTTAFPVILILAREFIVTGLRLSAAAKGKVVAANIWGKIKTVIQSIALAATFILWLIISVTDGNITKISGEISAVPNILVWIVAVVTVISAIPYIKDCKEFIKD